MRGATSLPTLSSGWIQISTHTPHAGRDCQNQNQQNHCQISTHTPHAGRDICSSLYVNVTNHFYSHAPCGARLLFKSSCIHPDEFLLTRPMRGATILLNRSVKNMIFLLTRPMRGATIIYKTFRFLKTISTHTPHAGRDREDCPPAPVFRYFYSHAPCGARPRPRVPLSFLLNFYSHAPCGARPERLFLHPATSIFLLTRPMRGATESCQYVAKYVVISTHTPHAGRDALRLLLRHCLRISTHTPHAGRDGWIQEDMNNINNFYSHAPCGARLLRLLKRLLMLRFLLTRPMRGATQSRFLAASAALNFYSHAPCGARRHRRINISGIG